MNTFNPHIDADRVAQEPKTLDGTAPSSGSVPADRPVQYTMRRQQYISFTQEEAQRINQTLDLIEACTNKRISPNKLIKQATMQQAKQVLNIGEK